MNEWGACSQLFLLYVEMREQKWAYEILIVVSPASFSRSIFNQVSSFHISLIWLEGNADQINL